MGESDAVCDGEAVISLVRVCVYVSLKVGVNPPDHKSEMEFVGV